jgi:MOSC domain-containing protein YiiM
MNTPRVLSIQISEDKGQPMQSLTEANIIPEGIEGDRYAKGTGAFSNSKPPRNIDRHISLIEKEAIDAVRAESGIDVTFADTRRNIETIGIELNELVGKHFFIGEVLVEGVELCDPCARPGILSGKADLKNSFKELFNNRGGLRVRVLGTGKIRQGDVIKMEQ